MPQSQEVQNAVRDQNQDPTELTRQALWREIGSLKELVFTTIGGIQDAIKVAHDDMVRVPTEVQKAVGTLKDILDQKIVALEQSMRDAAQLRDEKFAGVAKQFETLNISIGKTSEVAKTAVDAALQAAKELVLQQNISAAQSAAKQEASFSKQIDAQGLLIQTTAKASDEKVNDIRERLLRLEAKKEGTAEYLSSHQSSSNLNINMIAIVVSVILAGFAIAAFFLKK